MAANDSGATRFRRVKPTSPNHRPKLTMLEVLAQLKSGAYTVDKLTGAVRTRAGRKVRGFLTGKDGGPKYRYVRVHARRAGVLCVKTVAVSHLAWMAVTGSLVPDGFELHHRDRDTRNDAWRNLLCLHTLDHAKVHVGEVSAIAEEPIPF